MTVAGPSASCVIPVHDGVRWVAAAIRSVLAQTAPPQEIIVVDDGSTDGAAREIEAFGPQVIALRQDHEGVAAARNHGVSRATGDLLCFLDADDLWHPDRLRLQMALLADHPEVELCDAHSRYIWAEDLTLGERVADPRYGQPFWRRTDPGHIGTWLVRREAFARVGGFDDSLQYSEDTDWLLRYRDGGGATVTHPEVLSFRRLHRGNMTAGDRPGQARDLIRAVNRSRRRRQGAAANG